MRLVDLIRKKRMAATQRPEIEFLVRGYTLANCRLPDAAWLMAVVLKGMSRAETAALTQAMLPLGRSARLARIPQKKSINTRRWSGRQDVLDSRTIVRAAAGPISWTRLGQPSTLDKLESIPGFNVNLSSHQMRSVLAACGACMIGQTATIGPADKKIVCSARRDRHGRKPP